MKKTTLINGLDDVQAHLKRYSSRQDLAVILGQAKLYCSRQEERLETLRSELKATEDSLLKLRGLYTEDLCKFYLFIRRETNSTDAFELALFGPLDSTQLEANLLHEHDQKHLDVFGSGNIEAIRRCEQERRKIQSEVVPNRINDLRYQMEQIIKKKEAK